LAFYFENLEAIKLGQAQASALIASRLASM